MKKVLIAVILTSLIFLTSCIPQNTEIRYRLVIEGIGIDYDTENDLYELTVQVLETGNSDPEQGKSSSPVTNYTVKGKTIAEAISSLCENTGKYPLYSQNRIIILGSTVTAERMIKSLNFFVREYTSRPDVFIAAAEGKASDILTTEVGSEVPAKLIESEIELCHDNSLSVDTELYNTVNLTLEETSCFTLPLLEITEDRIPDGKTIKITGTRACSERTDPLNLSAAETQAYLFIMNDVKTGSLSTDINSTTVGFDIIESETKTTLSTENEAPFFLIEVNCKVDVIEFGADSFDSFSQNDLKETETAVAQQIAHRMSGILDRMLKKEKCDIFRFRTRIAQKYPGLNDKINSDDLLSSIDYKVRVTVDAGRIGQMTMH